MENRLGLYITFVFYIVSMFFIGIYFYRRAKTSGISNYFLGERQMNPWVTALSAQSSDMSAWLFMSLPGAAYLFGYQACWIAIGLAIGTYINWKVIARRLRNFSYAFSDSITIPQYLQERFKSNSKLIQLVCSIVILIFFTLYIASGFSAEAKLFSEVFGMQYHTGLFIGAAIIVSYTYLGGFHAVCWTEFFQGILMFFAIITVPIIVFFMMSESQVTQVFTKDFVWGTLFSSQHNNTAGEIISGLGWGLGYFGMPHILVRFMAIRSSDEIKRSRKIALTWVYLTLIAAVGIGIFGHAYLSSQGITYNSQLEAETVFMHLSTMLFPPWVAGILLSAILAAIMSTVSSQLLVLSSAMVNDIYHLYRKRSNERRSMILSRLAVILVAIIGLWIAMKPDNTIMGFVQHAVSGFGATFGPSILLSLVWKRLTETGVISGMIAGASSVMIWEGLNLYTATGYTSMVPCFVFSTAVVIIGSLCTKKPSQEVTECFDRAVNM